MPLAVKSYCWKLAEESNMVDQGRTIKEDPGKGLVEVLQRKALGNPRETRRKPQGNPKETLRKPKGQIKES